MKIKLFIFFIIFQGKIIFALSEQPKNVILITVDALRPDHLGCYGYKRNTSPNIDYLAKEGVLFTQAISQVPYTAGSFAATFTSTYPKQHKVIGLNEKLELDNLTLAEILREKGFVTKAITTNFILSNAFGFNQGFEPQEFKEYEGKDETEVAINWLKENIDKRMFLWIHYMEPHAPYEPLPEHNVFLDFINSKGELPIVENEQGEGGIPKYVVRNNRRDLDYYIALYDGEIRTADAKIGRLLEGLKELKLIDDSLIIFLSDHGEELGEHGFYFSHGTLLYDSSVRVPLIIKYKNFEKGKIIDSQVRLLDISPTILDILGIKIPRLMKGKSLVPLITGKKNNFNLIAYSYMIGKFAIRWRGWKLIYNYNKPNLKFELYNLNTDPSEKNNLAKSSPYFLSLKRKMFIERDRVLPKKMPPPSKIEDEYIIERMKSLGYSN